jgi:hypothetical protein
MEPPRSSRRHGDQNSRSCLLLFTSACLTNTLFFSPLGTGNR